jgi:hypothetical protein
MIITLIHFSHNLTFNSDINEYIQKYWVIMSRYYLKSDDGRGDWLNILCLISNILWQELFWSL